MPLTFNQVSLPNLNDATRLVAQYMPNIGEDISNIGIVANNQAQNAKNVAETMKALAEMQEKDQKKAEDLRIQNYINNNSATVNDLLKSAYSGQYERIYDANLPYFMQSTLRELAGGEATKGENKRKTDAQISKDNATAQAEIARVGQLQAESLIKQLELKEKQRVANEDEALRTLQSNLFRQPELISGLTAGLNHPDTNKQIEALQNAKKLFPFLQDVPLKKLAENIKEYTKLFPESKANYIDFIDKTNTLNTLGEEALRKTVGSNTAVPLQAYRDLAENGYASTPINIGGVNLSENETKALSDNTLVRAKANALLQRLAKEQKDKKQPLNVSLQHAIYAVLNNATMHEAWWSPHPLQLDNLANGFDYYREDSYDQLKAMNKEIKDIEPLITAFNTKTGIFPQLIKDINKKIEAYQSSYFVGRKPLSNQEMYDQLVKPFVEQAIKKHKISPKQAQLLKEQIESHYLTGFSPLSLAQYTPQQNNN